MDETTPETRLSQIATHWSMVCAAHGASATTMASARQWLVERYAGAVRRYLLGAVRDVDAADELFQEFALRFVRGDFRRANPERGRFRNYVKTALFHLIVDYQRERGEWPRALPADHPGAAEESASLSEQEFVNSWRNELVSRAWNALAEAQQTSGSPYHAVLQSRVDHPDQSSAQLAQQLTAQLGKTCTAGHVRVILHRAREMFADRLRDEVAQSLDHPTPQDIEQELTELRLWVFCRPSEFRTHQS